MENFGYVVASKMLVEGRRKVRFMYHETPRNQTGDEAKDSGWRFFCGDEDQAYVDRAENLGIYDVGTILELDGSVRFYLSAAVNTAYERFDDTSPFKPVDDFGFGRDLE